MQLNFHYAEVKRTKDLFYVSFYVRHPETGKMKRFQKWVKQYKSISLRKREATKLAGAINQSLDDGWNPFVSNDQKHRFMPVEEALKDAVRFKEKYVGQRTLYDYRNALNHLWDFLHAEKIDVRISEFGKPLAHRFVDYHIKKTKAGAQTINNRIDFIKTLFQELVKRSYIDINPFTDVRKLPVRESYKRLWQRHEIANYFNYVAENNKALCVASALVYYCAIRPAEIVRCRRSFFELDKRYIVLPADVTKNGKKAVVSIPDECANLLIPYLNNVPEHHYLYAKGGQGPGTTPELSKILANHFRKAANNIGLSGELKLYGLKDAVADLLTQQGVDIKTVRDHFRHSSVNITDKYLKKNNPYLNKNSAILQNYPSAFASK